MYKAKRKEPPRKVWYTVEFSLEGDDFIKRCVCLRAFDSAIARRDASAFLHSSYKPFVATASVERGLHWSKYLDRVFLNELPTGNG